MSAVDIIIVNWNAGPQLKDCLEAIERSDTHGIEWGRIVVVDNASEDGSVEGVASLQIPLLVIRNNSNRGFGAACNQGAGQSKADFLLFLNPDAKLLSDSLPRAVECLAQGASIKVGIVGIQLLDSKGNVSRTCARFPTPTRLVIQMLGLSALFPNLFHGLFMSDWDHSETREVDHVMGAFYLIRRDLFEALTGFDERFFVYQEDLDLSVRARKAGWKSLYFAGAQAYHKGGGTSEQVKAQRLAYALHSRLLYAYKHFSYATATCLLIGTFTLELVARLVRALIQRSPARALETLYGYVLLIRRPTRK